MAAQSELHERIVHVETTHRSDLWSQTSSPATSVRLLYVYCALIAFISRSYCAVTVLLRRFMGQLPLILRPHCAATETMTLVIRSRRCSYVCNRFSMRSYCDHTYTDPQCIKKASSSAHNQCASVIFSMAIDRQNCAAVSTYAGTGWSGPCQHHEKEEKMEKKGEKMIPDSWHGTGATRRRIPSGRSRC